MVTLHGSLEAVVGVTNIPMMCSDITCSVRNCCVCTVLLVMSGVCPVPLRIEVLCSTGNYLPWLMLSHRDKNGAWHVCVCVCVCVRACVRTCAS